MAFGVTDCVITPAYSCITVRLLDTNTRGVVVIKKAQSRLFLKNLFCQEANRGSPIGLMCV